MRVICAIQVGDETELIDEHIAYHQSLGIDGFVLVDLGSTDGTSEKLERYRDDPRFVIRRVDFDEVSDDVSVRLPELSSWMIGVARDHFAADWIVRLDADEFLFPATGDIRKSLAHGADARALQLDRRNVVFPSPRALTRTPRDWAGLAGMTIVSDPVRVTVNDYDPVTGPPLNMTNVAPKLIARADALDSFLTGAHLGKDRDGNRVAGRRLPDLIAVHFWFTTRARFARKARAIAAHEEELRRRYHRGLGWQWSHWAQVAREGEDSILREYRHQFPGEARFARLIRDGVIRRARDHWG